MSKLDLTSTLMHIVDMNDRHGLALLASDLHKVGLAVDDVCTDESVKKICKKVIDGMWTRYGWKPGDEIKKG